MEDISLRAVWTNIGFIYDPVSNSWSSQLIEAFGSGRIGDAMGTVLADGRFVLSDIGSGNIEVLNPATLRFTPLNPPGKRDQNNEEGWNILPDGTVFTVDATGRGVRIVRSPNQFMGSRRNDASQSRRLLRLGRRCW